MKTITFYSYKGGVGRSLTLANIATRLLEFDRKVCLLDFDLEAPGLHYKLEHLTKDIKIEKGIVDYVYSFSNGGALPEKISDYSIDIRLPKGGLSLIPAGNTGSSLYWKKLSSINWHSLLYENKSGISFFLDLKEKIKKEINPDFLLIDSRTGISEMSGITISLFADDVVIVAANNRENLEGAKKVIKSLSNYEDLLLGRPIKITFVLSRIPFTEKPEDKAKEQNLLLKIKAELSEFSINEINVIHSDRDLEENEQIKIGYERDDSSAQISRDYLQLFEKITENELRPEEIKKFTDIKESEKFFQKALQAESHNLKLDLISKAINLNPDNLDFIIQRGLFFEQMEDFDNARKDYLKVIPKYNNSFSLLLKQLLAGLEFKAGNNEEAKKLYEYVLSNQSKNYQAYLGLGLINSAQGKFNEALNVYTKAISINPLYANAYNNRAIAYMKMGDFEAALTDAYKALELNSDEAMHYFTLAEINAYMQRYHEFYLNVENGLKINPKLIEKTISEEPIYDRFLNEDRFQHLLEKYNVFFTT